MLGLYKGIGQGLGYRSDVDINLPAAIVLAEFLPRSVFSDHGGNTRTRCLLHRDAEVIAVCGQCTKFACGEDIAHILIRLRPSVPSAGFKTSTPIIGLRAKGFRFPIPFRKDAPGFDLLHSGAPHTCANHQDHDQAVGLSET
jgi:hypothetical protein